VARLNLNFACGSYDLLRPLWEKVVEPAGIDLNVMTMPSPERHGRMLRHEEFDACELSLVGYLVAHDQGRAFTAIPAFPHRRFRHSYMVKRTGCGIDKPSDLNGKRIGLDTLQNSAGLWMRGILQDYYGLDLRTVEWWCQEEEDVPLEPASWMKVNRVAGGRDIDEMLRAGELEGALYPEVLPSIREGSDKVALLFPDPRQAEVEYYRESGIFPIMHTVSIRRELLDEHPWVAATLMKAFSEAKDLAVADLTQTSALPLTLPFLTEHAYQTVATMGEDFWPYGLESNRKTLETFVRYMHEQGMIERPMPIEELFAASTHRTFRI
jgi:4,5-dihydroxyphthalate decarboxylase